jgi:hypothetical protein
MISQLVRKVGNGGKIGDRQPKEQNAYPALPW